MNQMFRKRKNITVPEAPADHVHTQDFSPTKPSEEIRLFCNAIAMRRMAKQRGVQTIMTGAAVILSAQEEERVLAGLRDDPMTWIMSILTWLDKDAAKAKEARAGSAHKSDAELEDGLCSLCGKGHGDEIHWTADDRIHALENFADILREEQATKANDAPKRLGELGL